MTSVERKTGHATITFTYDYDADIYAERCDSPNDDDFREFVIDDLHDGGADLTLCLATITVDVTGTQWPSAGGNENP
jgi:hypothetical protein